MNDESDTKQKFLKMTFHSDGRLDLESNNVTVFDLWAVSSYLKMRGDELYVSMQTQLKMQDAASKDKRLHLASPAQLSESQRKAIKS